MSAARLALLLLALGVVARAAEPTAPAVVIIVHPSRTDHVDLETLERIYLRQRHFWQSGEPVLPVNREYGSETRKAFERAVFGELKVPLSRYWNEQYFLGVLPPATLASDAAVRQYVAARPSAVGYIDARDVDDSVRVLLRLE
jgi:ABC-type phosphate transport system substrate-binding protein